MKKAIPLILFYLLAESVIRRTDIKFKCPYCEYQDEIEKSKVPLSFKSCLRLTLVGSNSPPLGSALMILIFPLGILLSGCSSANPYYVDRERDSLDIFSLSAECGLGAKARFGPIGSGLIYSDSSYGLRGGEILGLSQEETADIEAGVIGIEQFDIQCYDPNHIPNRVKTYSSMNILGVNFPVSSKTPPPPHPYYFYSQLDVAICIFGGVRFGFNVGELLDFTLGWVGIDIYGDDVGIVKADDARKVYGKRILLTVPPPAGKP